MNSSTDSSMMNRRFDGFRNTPFLWNGQLEGLVAYELSPVEVVNHPQVNTSPGIRLGKLVEEFVLHELKTCDSVQVLASNLQVFKDRITIGEIDTLIKNTAKQIHLEMVYKFYLYDPTYPEEIDRWIGPNRKDSFVLKLRKLIGKQFPLLYRPETVRLLKEHHLEASQFEQQVYFKAQLFVPFGEIKHQYPLINNDCIKGFYLRVHELAKFDHCTFYIPTKLDWLSDPHTGVNWLTSTKFMSVVSALLAAQKSPLCWMQSPDGILRKFFVVWWS